MSPLLSATARLRSEGAFSHPGPPVGNLSENPFLPLGYRIQSGSAYLLAVPRTMIKSSRVTSWHSYDPVRPFSFLGDINIRYGDIAGIPRDLVTTIRKGHALGGLIIRGINVHDEVIPLPSGWGFDGGFWIMEVYLDNFPMGFPNDQRHKADILFDPSILPPWDFNSHFPITIDTANNHTIEWRLTYFVQFIHPSGVVGHIVPHNVELRGQENKWRGSRTDPNPRLLVEHGQPSRIEEVEMPNRPTLHNIFLEKIHNWIVLGYEMRWGWQYRNLRDPDYLVQNNSTPKVGEPIQDKFRPRNTYLANGYIECNLNWTGEFRVRS